MRLLKTLKSFKILLVVFLMLVGIGATAKDEPKDNNRTSDKEQIQEDQVEQEKSVETASVEPEENQADEDGISISNSSFNYFFYLIYKIKFADIFNLPNQNSLKTRASTPSVNLNSLLEKLITPEI